MLIYKIGVEIKGLLYLSSKLVARNSHWQFTPENPSILQISHKKY